LHPYIALTMARPKPSIFDKKKTVAENRRARFEYFIDDVYEAGIALTGTEVKSCALARAPSPRPMPR
jgi:SsrA-binding protein